MYNNQPPVVCADLRKFDDTTDSLSVELGINLFKTYPNPNNLDATTLMEAISGVPYPIREGSKNK